MSDVIDVVDQKARLDAIAAAAERWQQQNADVIAGLPIGATVIIDIESGDFVSGPTWQDAERVYVQRFGDENRPSFTFDVGRPLFIGGHLWRT